ncbi:MAG: 6-pyruvoyl trahydropterin synthase family protein [Planctomycetota bacterium]|jgi:6-pyruvoyltetrahydropterin/6-carboxytetrahydropterin synthase
MEVFCEFTVEAAHYLPKVPPGHPCGRLHGHSYRLGLHVSGPLDAELGWVVDYADVQKAFEPLRQELDNQVLNEVSGLANPTSENLARWIWARLQPTLPGLAKVVVRETATTGCTYRGEPD